MSPILVPLTSRSDSDFDRSNISFKENKPDGVDLNCNGLTTAFERTKENFCGFGRLNAAYPGLGCRVRTAQRKPGKLREFSNHFYNALSE